MKALLLVGILAMPACAGSADPQDRIVQRAKDIVESCARSERCAQRSDQDATGYRACTADTLVVQSTAWVDRDRLSVILSCSAGDGFLFQVVVHGLMGPAFEEVVQCKQLGCPMPEEAFAPVI